MTSKTETTTGTDQASVESVVMGFKQRMEQCLFEQGVKHESTRDLLPLYRLVRDVVPDRSTLQQMKMACTAERERAKSAVAVAEKCRDTVERILCDCPTKTEVIRELERLLADTSPEDDVAL